MLNQNDLLKLQRNPVGHIEKIQGVSTLTEYQKKICREIAANNQVAISACHDVGKTYIMAKIALWFGSSFPRSKIITTAPSWPQVELLLWSEIRSGWASSKMPLGGRMLTTEWKIDDDWFAVGMSPREDADGSGGGQGTTSGFQGFHAPYILVIFDEATGVSTKRWIQAQGMLTSANVRFVVIGNPTTKNCEFYRCFQSRVWKKIHITCFDSPNLQANGIMGMETLKAEVERVRLMSDAQAQERLRSYKVVAGSLLTLSWVIERALVWGIDHPLFVSKVLGGFPEEDDSTLISLGTVEQAQARTSFMQLGQRIGIGVDVARYGDDNSVITSMWGPNVLRPKMLMKRDTMEIAGATIQEIDRLIEIKADPALISVGVDATGIGAGVIDSLLETQRGGQIHPAIQIHEIHFGQRFDYIKKDREREEYDKLYANRKAKIFVELANDMKQEIVLPPEGIYSEELPTLMARFDSKGRHVMESKEDYRTRTGRPSPDHSDSLAIANEMRKLEGSGVGVIRVI